MAGFDPNIMNTDATLPGLDVGNHLPAGDAAKFAQKVHDDYLHGNIEPDAIERDGKINPVKHALHKFQEAGMEGGVTMALFGTMFLGLSALGTAMIGGFLGALSGVIATGLLWYGGKAGIQAYRDAQEHNHAIEEIAESPEIVKAQSKQKEVDLANDVSEKGMVAILAAPVLMSAEHEQSQERPEFLANIIDNGPKSLSPKELAAQIEAERSGASQAM